MALSGAAAAYAAVPELPAGDARTYVTARAAALDGDHARSAELLAQLVKSNSDAAIARRAISQAISAGDMALALRLAQGVPQASMPIEAKLLIVAEEIRSNRTARALEIVRAPANVGDLGFFQPFLNAWAAAERNDGPAALGAIGAIPRSSILGHFGAEHRALLFLKLGRAAPAEPFARRAIETAGGRAQRLRLAMADGFLAAGDRPRALAMLDGMGIDADRARQRLLQNRSSGTAIDTVAKAYSELLLGLAVDLNRLNDKSLPIALAQVARHATPKSSSAAILLGILLQSDDRTAEALAAFRSVDARDGLASQARDSEVRALVSAERVDEALAIARKAAAARDANAIDFARLGDVLAALERYDESADAYNRAVLLSDGHPPDERWPLMLLKASSLESADRWLEARSALGAALAIAPEEPLILNFLGYAKLERGEDLETAEIMIQAASELAPEDASITDSLGWAQFKRGRVTEAIGTLQRAAQSDPSQAEIHEHLGDALYTAGRRYEARFAWQAALATASEDVAPRIAAKIDYGLSPATAAP